ncbi:MAG TPA: thioesterase family protein [Bacilli bacterium]|nr:thioesterase family protein [Bacilli bacterium]
MDSKTMKLSDFPLRTYDKIRYCDTDRQGHVNNAVFNSFFETGRTELFFNPKRPLYSDNCQFVIADIQVAFLKEINWPGTVEIGTAITKIGNSSIAISQSLFQNDIKVADAISIIVHMNETTRRSQPLSEETKQVLTAYIK